MNIWYMHRISIFVWLPFREGKIEGKIEGKVEILESDSQWMTVAEIAEKLVISEEEVQKIVDASK